MVRIKFKTHCSSRRPENRKISKAKNWIFIVKDSLSCCWQCFWLSRSRNESKAWISARDEMKIYYCMITTFFTFALCFLVATHHPHVVGIFTVYFQHATTTSDDDEIYTFYCLESHSVDDGDIFFFLGFRWNINVEMWKYFHIFLQLLPASINSYPWLLLLSCFVFHCSSSFCHACMLQLISPHNLYH